MVCESHIKSSNRIVMSNVAIAAAVTAYARIHMSKFKNNPDFKLYYSDTDNIVINKPLASDMIGSELGQLKLEHTITKAVFLAPKVYGLITDTGKELIKVKGLMKDAIHNINFDNLQELLVKDATRQLTQEKGYKSLFDANISISSIIYTLKATSNKRQNIYVNGIFDSTKPFKYKDIIKK